MWNRPTTRRSFLAGAGAVAVAATAGCQGDGDEGDKGTTTDDGNGGAAGTEDPQPRGELVVSETITDDTEWEVDLAEGDTITVVATGTSEDTGVDGNIHQFERTERLAAFHGGTDNPDTVQHTAEEDATYVVDAYVSKALSSDEGEGTIEIYVASG